MNTELYHHGILGQKWGVRRFENKNGHLTAAGKARYNENVKKAFGNEYANADILKPASEKVNKMWTDYYNGNKQNAKVFNKNLAKAKQIQDEADKKVKERNMQIFSDEKVQKMIMKANDLEKRLTVEYFEKKPNEASKALDEYQNTISKIGRDVAKGYADETAWSMNGRENKYSEVIKNYVDDAIRYNHLDLISSPKAKSNKMSEEERELVRDLKKNANNMSEEERELLRELS